MATVKLATLTIRTAAKPISARIKAQAKEHETFRNFCVSLAQTMYRTEVRLRTGILGEPAKTVRPLSETRAIENGANAIAEGFLFAVAATLILGEAYRSSRSESRRRSNIDDQLAELTEQVEKIKKHAESLGTDTQEQLRAERERNDELSRILERVVEIGLRGGWAEFKDAPIQLPAPSRAPPTRDTLEEEQVGPSNPHTGRADDSIEVKSNPTPPSPPKDAKS